MLQLPAQVGVILVDHGSRRNEANAMLLDVVAMFKRYTQYAIVEPAHMELADPDIAAAFAACVAQGATYVVVHPYFLAPGRHSTSDIPRLVSEAAQNFPLIGFHVTQPLGLDEKMAQIILDRINHCVQHQYRCDYCVGTGCCDARTAHQPAPAGH